MVNQEVKTMSKDEAIKHVQEIFKGHDTFISYCTVMIASTSNFKGIESHQVTYDGWSWETYLRVTLSLENSKGEVSFKQLHYKKGNQKYADKNQTSDIHEYFIATIENGQAERFYWDA